VLTLAMVSSKCCAAAAPLWPSNTQNSPNVPVPCKEPVESLPHTSGFQSGFVRGFNHMHGSSLPGHALQNHSV